MSKGVSIFVFALLLGACSATSAGDTATTEPAPTTTSSTTTTTLAEATGGEIESAAIFLLSVDDALQGTIHEGAPLDDPETFLAMGQLFCDLLDSGLSMEEVMGGYAAAIVVQYPEETLAVDDLRLGGAVLGAAVVVLCPEYGEGL